MTDISLKKLTICIENEQKEDVVVIFAEPSAADLEELICNQSILNLVTDHLWIKKERGEENKEDVVESKRVVSESWRKGEDVWMDVWGRERRKHEDADMLSHEEFQVKSEMLSTKFLLDKADLQLENENLVQNLDVLDFLKMDEESLPYDDYKEFDNEKKSAVVFKKEKSKKSTKKRTEIKKPLPGEKPFVCPVCQKAFSHIRYLEDHKRTHTGEKPFICDICGKTFAQSGSLVTHKKIHSGVKLFACEICEMTFSRSANLAGHLKTHSDEKEFSCDVCKKAFSQARYLKDHMRIHTGEKPYVCDVCGKAFPQSNKLTIHKRTHTGVKPYACDICKKAFSQSNDLKKHKRTHSNDKPF